MNTDDLMIYLRTHDRDHAFAVAQAVRNPAKGVHTQVTSTRSSEPGGPFLYNVRLVINHAA